MHLYFIYRRDPVVFTKWEGTSHAFLSGGRRWLEKRFKDLDFWLCCPTLACDIGASRPRNPIEKVTKMQLLTGEDVHLQGFMQVRGKSKLINLYCGGC
jgi:hypothetical protein